MQKTKLITVPVSDGDWEVSCSLTQEQAFKILSARGGETVKLNRAREEIYVHDKDCLRHTMAANFPDHNDGTTSEGLQRYTHLSTLKRTSETTA